MRYIFNILKEELTAVDGIYGKCSINEHLARIIYELWYTYKIQIIRLMNAMFNNIYNNLIDMVSKSHLRDINFINYIDTITTNDRNPTSDNYCGGIIDNMSYYKVFCGVPIITACWKKSFIKILNSFPNNVSII